MTPISDELLMAYADGELDAAKRSEIERALAADAVLAERAQRQAVLRQRVEAAFQPALAEPVPARLLQALKAAPPAPANPDKVVQLAPAREARGAHAIQPRALDWTAWGGMAASLLLGMLIGKLVPSSGPDVAAFETEAGRLVARGAIEQALSTRLASAPAAGDAVAVQLSFVDKAGHYCRTFSTAAMAGLACRDGARWTLQQAAAVGAGPSGAMRQAASALPAAILGAVDQRIDGPPLDAAGEQAALRSGWQK